MDEIERQLLELRRLCHWLARKYCWTCGAVDLEDYKQEAAIACWKALILYDPRRGVKLETFVTEIVSGHLMHVSRMVRAWKYGVTKNTPLGGHSLGEPIHSLLDLDLDHLATEPGWEAEIDSRIFVTTLFSQLKDRDRQILRRFYLQKQSLRQTAAAMNLSEDRLFKVKKRALERLERLWNDASG